MAVAGRSEAEEAPVDARLVFTGVSLPLVAPTPATLPQVETFVSPYLHFILHSHPDC